ncbi:MULTISPECIES: hypothetical protein [Mameliella]|uniref:Uncharacterized protein n=1 Tax=Mameliella alba TaxID=561184 RepID=A0A0B3RRM4_9RHOB|nr:MULTISPECIES: hypothetical protein [Mameliella]MBV6637157.1 hypothetical protein [Mameliella sp.]MCR9275160.1 hypothetical protein [Paracoccaceae bacterium]KHQ50552.1 hypothetical protein OA50_04920 [Mameliella alba]MBY6122202.1 hypothetical protein [Mameliella alba]MDD9732376.1 hypothetical protein [Mameliella sp. AT18]
MKRILLALAAAAALVTGPALADVGPVFLPDLTFPAPQPHPDMSSQGCAGPQVCK